MYLHIQYIQSSRQSPARIVAANGTMILIGIGANLNSPIHGPPLATCEASLVAMEDAGIHVVRRSRWYRSAPVPASSQPWYINAVVEVASTLAPIDLLASLRRIENDFGRLRSSPNTARTLDLDLLAISDMVIETTQELELPHPRMHLRAFVLLPLAELDHNWIHPVSGKSLTELIAALPPEQVAKPLNNCDTLGLC